MLSRWTDLHEIVIQGCRYLMEDIYPDIHGTVILAD